MFRSLRSSFSLAQDVCSRMQAAIRSALQEAARGMSTAVVVWAGQQPNHCSCSCPKQPRCPDCLCQGSTRVCERNSVEDYSLVAVCLALAVGVLAGLAASRISSHTWGGAPRATGDSRLALALSDEAAEQVRLLKQRRHGAGHVLDR